VINLRVEPVDSKHIRISGIHPVLLDCLHALPEILEQRDTPAARQRLMPDPTTTDTKANTEWQRHVAPELRHLFVAAGETVARDLTGLTPDGQLTFSTSHVAAWMSAANQSRLILGELFHITDADMESTDFDVKTPKGLAIFRIHVLGWLLQLLVDLEAGHAGVV
jgi:hypothetical protein